jgi:hypothetical protein
MFAEMRRLHERGPGCRGLVVDSDGVMLGADCVLVRRTVRGFEAADSEQLAGLTKTVFADDARLRRLPQVLAGVVSALEEGDLVKAQLLGLALRLGKLDEAQLRRLSRAGGLAKDAISFDPDQPRDERGRWTTEGGQPVSGAAAARMTMPPPQSPWLGEVAPAALRALGQVASRFAGPVAFLGTLLIPTNRSLITEGTVSGREDLKYEYDEDARIVTLYRDEDGHRTFLLEAKPDFDGIIRDATGRAIGRKIGDSAVVLDPDMLPGADRRIGDKGPEVCPDPAPDRPGGMSERASTYQEQISGLAPGLAVRLPSRSDDPNRDPYVYFDGCIDGVGGDRATMLDAKGGDGFLDMLVHRHSFFEDVIMEKLAKQANRQVTAANGRPIEWHFADKEVADFVREKFKERGLDISVKWTPLFSGSGP